METVYVADKSLVELVSLFSCDIENDDDFYDVIAYNIARISAGQLLNNIEQYDGARLRGAMFGLGLTLKGDKKFADLLMTYLSHADHLIVAASIDALKNAEIKSAWNFVAQLAEHKSPYVQGAVLRYARYVFLPKDSLPVLFAALKSSHYIVRENAVDELAELGDPIAIEQIEPLLEDPHPHVKQSAYTAIRSLRNKGA